MACSVPDCRVNPKIFLALGLKIYYYELPTDVSLRQLWINKCKIPAEVDLNNARVCTRHFSVDDFGRPPLKENVVPSLKLPEDINEGTSEISSKHCKDTETTADESVVAKKVKDEPPEEEIQITELQKGHSPSSAIFDIKMEDPEMIEFTSEISSEHSYYIKLTADESDAAIKIKDEPPEEEIEIMELYNEQPSSPIFDIKMEETDLIEFTTEISSEHCKDINITTDESDATKKFKDEPPEEEIEITVLQEEHSPSSPIFNIKIDESEIIEFTSELSSDHCKDIDIMTDESDAAEYCKNIDYQCSLSTSPIEIIERYKCFVCDYTFKYPSQLKYHMRTHKRQNAFKCSVCKQPLANLGKLTEHMKKHSSENLLKCSMCDYTTFIRANITKHIKRHPRVNAVKPSISNATSALNGGVKEHLKKPTEFQCPSCNRSYLVRHNLTRHMNATGHFDVKERV